MIVIDSLLLGPADTCRTDTPSSGGNSTCGAESLPSTAICRVNGTPISVSAALTAARAVSVCAATGALRAHSTATATAADTAARTRARNLIGLPVALHRLAPELLLPAPLRAFLLRRDDCPSKLVRLKLLFLPARGLRRLLR